MREARNHAAGQAWKAEVLPLLSWSAQMLRSPGMCDAITDHLCLWAQAATSCTKTCKGQEVVNSLLTPPSEAVLSVPILELARKASGFRERAVQLLIEELDAAALVRALGLEQRVFARPLGGRPLGHLSSRKAGVIRPRSGLFQKPCLHATEGRRGSHLFEQLRRFEISIIEKARKKKRELGIFFLLALICALARGSRRAAPPAGGEFCSLQRAP